MMANHVGIFKEMFAKVFRLEEAQIIECGSDIQTERSIVILSMCSKEDRAVTAVGLGDSLASALENGLENFTSAATTNIKWQWFKIDVVHSAQKYTANEVKSQIALSRRNYFRKGIAFDHHFSLALTEQELNGIAAIGPNRKGDNTIRIDKILSYLKRSRKIPNIPKNTLQSDSWYIFDTRGYFFDRNDPSQRVHVLRTGGYGNGLRTVVNMNREVERLIRVSSIYLSDQLLPSGKFVYGHFPVKHAAIPTYNILRHCTTLYSMLEAWEITRENALLNKVYAGINYTITNSIRCAGDCIYVIDYANERELKLGAQAALVLVIAKLTLLTGDHSFVSIAQSVARGILAKFFHADSGQYSHVLYDTDFSLKDEFRIIYYDGEATLALLRLYRIDSNPFWLNAAKLAFDNFITQEYWKYHDHWLAYCSNDITQILPEDKYFEFGLKNAFDNLDFILHRETAYPTFLELLMSAYFMIKNIMIKQKYYLLESYNIEKLIFALHKRARHQINSHFYPEMAMYFEKPSKIVGSFYIRHHAFRIRIDDVEHFISGLCLYLNEFRPIHKS